MMAKMSEIKWGWKPPTLEKRFDNSRWPLTALGLEVPLTVEQEFPYDAAWASVYDQDGKGSCAANSSCFAMSSYNMQVYNWYRLYKKAQSIDNDERTSDDDDGTYLWAVGDWMRKHGLAYRGQEVDLLNEGILEYRWVHTIDQLLAAFSSGLRSVIGMPWFEDFNTPRLYNSEYWIGRSTNWKQMVGGHAIWDYRISSQREAVRLRNTWGRAWLDSWFGFRSLERVLSYGGELMVLIDRVIVPPPDESRAVRIDIEGYGPFVGRVTKGVAA